MSGPASGEPGRPERTVPFIRVRCNACRRAHGAALVYAMRRGEEPSVPVCPHYRTVWAPGFGPGSEPRPGSGWSDRTPPV